MPRTLAGAPSTAAREIRASTSSGASSTARSHPSHCRRCRARTRSRPSRPTLTAPHSPRRRRTTASRPTPSARRLALCRTRGDHADCDERAPVPRLQPPAGSSRGVQRDRAGERIDRLRRRREPCARRPDDRPLRLELRRRHVARRWRAHAEPHLCAIRARHTATVTVTDSAAAPSPPRSTARRRSAPARRRGGKPGRDWSRPPRRWPRAAVSGVWPLTAPQRWIAWSGPADRGVGGSHGSGRKLLLTWAPRASTQPATSSRGDAAQLARLGDRQHASPPRERQGPRLPARTAHTTLHLAVYAYGPDGSLTRGTRPPSDYRDASLRRGGYLLGTGSRPEASRRKQPAVSSVYLPIPIVRPVMR